MHYKLRVFFFIALVSFQGLAYSSSRIEGAWIQIPPKERAEFFKDGTSVHEAGKVRLSGKWISLGDGRIKLDIVFLGTPSTLFVRVKDDEMTIDSPGEQPSRYFRENSTKAREDQASLVKQAEEKQRIALAQQMASAKSAKQAEKAAAEKAVRQRAAMADDGTVLKEFTWQAPGAHEYAPKVTERLQLTESHLLFTSESSAGTSFIWYAAIAGFEPIDRGRLKVKKTCLESGEPAYRIPDNMRAQFFQEFEAARSKWRQRHGEFYPFDGGAAKPYCGNGVVGVRYGNSVPSMSNEQAKQFFVPSMSNEQAKQFLHDSLSKGSSIRLGTFSVKDLKWVKAGEQVGLVKVTASETQGDFTKVTTEATAAGSPFVVEEHGVKLVRLPSKVKNMRVLKNEVHSVGDEHNRYRSITFEFEQERHTLVNEMVSIMGTPPLEKRRHAVYLIAWDHSEKQWKFVAGDIANEGSPITTTTVADTLKRFRKSLARN